MDWVEGRRNDRSNDRSIREKYGQEPELMSYKEEERLDLRVEMDGRHVVQGHVTGT